VIVPTLADFTVSSFYYNYC